MMAGCAEPHTLEVEVDRRLVGEEEERPGFYASSTPQLLITAHADVCPLPLCILLLKIAKDWQWLPPLRRRGSQSNLTLSVGEEGCSWRLFWQRIKRASHTRLNTPSPPPTPHLALVPKTYVTLEGAQKSGCDLTLSDLPTVVHPAPSARQMYKKATVGHVMQKAARAHGEQAAATIQSAGCLCVQVSRTSSRVERQEEMTTVRVSVCLHSMCLTLEPELKMMRRLERQPTLSINQTLGLMTANE